MATARRPRPTSTPYFRTVMYMSSTSTMDSSSYPSSYGGSHLTPTVSETQAPIPHGSDIREESYEPPSRALLEEHTRVAMEIYSSGIPARTSGAVDLGALASSNQRVVFRELIKINMTIRQTHTSITKAYEEFRLLTGITKAYPEFKLLTNITKARVAPHPDNLFVLVSMFKPLTDLFSLAKDKFLPVMEVLYGEDHPEGLATGFDCALLALGSTVRSTIEMVQVWISDYATVDGINHGSGVHEITRYVMMYVKLLSEHSVLLDIALKVTLGIGPEGASPMENPEHIMANLIFHLESALELRSAYKVDAFRCVFLVNNIHFIQQEEETMGVFGDEARAQREEKMGFYISRYLDVSWAPVLSCLQNKIKLIPACFKPPATRRFNTMFVTTYQAQRSWKVEDPLLRKHMREAVIEKIIPGYRSFFEKQEKKPARLIGRSIPLIEYTPEELEEMLSELFEG